MQRTLGTVPVALVVAAAITSAGWRGAVLTAADEPGSSSSPREEADSDRKPPTSEWELLFDDGMTAIEYARQIDFFGIELAAIAKDGQIQYASHVSDRKPARRIGDQKDETRMSIYWRRGTLGAFEAKLMTKAGINTREKLLVHYYPRALEARLAKLERNFAGRNSDEIRRTRFKIRPVGDPPKGYEFYVDEQDAHEGKPTGSTTSGKQ